MLLAAPLTTNEYCQTARVAANKRRRSALSCTLERSFSESESARAAVRFYRPRARGRLAELLACNFLRRTSGSNEVGSLARR